MVQNHPENHPNGYTSRQLAFADARMAVANLCALDRTSAYKAAVIEVLRAIDDAAPADLETSESNSTAVDQAMWDLAVAEVGTVRVPPYGYPVIVLARPVELSSMFRAVAKVVRPGVVMSKSLDARDRERLLYAGRVLRAISDLGRNAPLGSLCSEASMGVLNIRHVLGITESKGTALGLAPSAAVTPPSPTALGALMAGWQEAGIAWGVASSIHRAFAEGRDPIYAKRQLEFNQRAATASSKCAVIAGPVLADVDI